MSAWMVTQEHVDVLVSAAVAFKLIEPDQATETGRMLWSENLESINYRYPDTVENTDHIPGPVDFDGAATVAEYVFTPRSVEEPHFIVKQLDCFAYQSCEHPGWEDSGARDLCDAIAMTIANTLHEGPEVMRDHPTYNAAAWGVDLDEHGELILTQADFSAFMRRMREAAA